MCRRSGHVPLSLQALKRGANGSSAHPETLGDFCFHDPRARSELSPNYHSAQRVVQPVGALGRTGRASSP